MKFDRPQRTDHGISERWNEAQRKTNPPIRPNPALAQALEHEGPPRRPLWRRLFHTRADQMAAWDVYAERAQQAWMDHLLRCTKCQKSPVGCFEGWELQIKANSAMLTTSLKLQAGGKWGWPPE